MTIIKHARDPMPSFQITPRSRKPTKYWKALQANDERYELLHCHEGEIVGVDLHTPLGVIELHHGHGEGPGHLAITMLNDVKVAVTIFRKADWRCRPLLADPICFGKWWPYSLFNHHASHMTEGQTPGMVRKGIDCWHLRCFAPDGTLVWVPIPRALSDVEDYPG